MLMNGSEIVIACLKEQGVDTVFGYPGGTILNIYDALYKHRDEIHHILTSHEQGAAHAADGYARASGRVGVCLATSGPGATNLVTGIATAYMDSIPIVAITCNVSLPQLGKDSFQEIDIAGITMPITKHNYIVKDITKLADTIRAAFRIARSGRPGPVLVDITKDVTAATADYEPAVPEPLVPVTENLRDADIEAAAKLICESKRPFFYVGGGVAAAGASPILREFVEKVDAPVGDSLLGKGAFDSKNFRYTGMIGMHGTKTSNFGISECDLLIAVGARFSDRVTGNTKTFAKNARVIHIDVDPAEINKNVHADVAVVGDCRIVLERLNDLVPPQKHDAWMRHILDLKNRYPLVYRKKGLTGPSVMGIIDRVAEGDTIITTDVGQHQMWAAQYILFRKPGQLLTSGGAGTMGYGLGAAIGAKMASPSSVVINVAGDGCFRMNMNELATASRYGIPIIQVVINNRVLGMVRQWQTLFYSKRYSNTILEDKVDFVKVSEGLGAKAVRVTTTEEFEAALQEAVTWKEGPYVIECVIEKDDKVFPMVAPGAGIEDTFGEEDMQIEA